MDDNGNHKKISFVSIDMGELEGRIEKLLGKENEQSKIRISCWSQDRLGYRPLVLSEKELINLLQKAIRAGILSTEFLEDLRSEFEI